MTGSVQIAATATTKQRINDAAVELFCRQGYNATSLRQIADGVGLQVGSLYNHISSKEELLFSIMREVMLELIAYTEAEMEAAGDDHVERLRAFLRSSVHFHATRRKQTFIGNTELRGLAADRREEIVALRDRYEQLLIATIESARDEGVIEVEDVQLAAYAALAMCTAVATWFRPEGRLALADIEQQLPRLFGPLATVS